MQRARVPDTSAFNIAHKDTNRRRVERMGRLHEKLRRRHEDANVRQPSARSRGNRVL